VKMIIEQIARESTARGGAMSWVSLNTLTGHAGSRHRHIRFSQRTIVTRPRQGTSRSMRGRRPWLAATTPHDGQPVWI